MYHLLRFKIYTAHTLFQYPYKKSLTDPISITILLGYIECRVGDDIFTIICHPFPMETLGQLGTLSVTSFHTEAAPQV